MPGVETLAMDGWMGRRRDVDLGGDRRSGGGPAGRRAWQAVQEMKVHSRPAREVN